MGIDVFWGYVTSPNQHLCLEYLELLIRTSGFLLHNRGYLIGGLSSTTRSQNGNAVRRAGWWRSKALFAMFVALPGSTSLQWEQLPPQRINLQLFMPLRCNKPCSMPLATSMQDMMVPLATDLCLFALQKSRMTNCLVSLVSL